MSSTQEQAKQTKAEMKGQVQEKAKGQGDDAEGAPKKSKAELKAERRAIQVTYIIYIYIIYQLNALSFFCVRYFILDWVEYSVSRNLTKSCRTPELNEFFLIIIGRYIL